MKTLAPILLLAAFTAQAGEIRFNRDIRPIISDRCFKCHGPDHNTREGGLRLDTFEGATGLLPDEPERRAIVPGKTSQSELIRRITSKDPQVVMPPADSELTLSAAEKALLQAWVEQGATYEKHWAFLPVERPAPPPGKKHPVDAFIEHRLQAEGLALSPETDRRALLKRVAFDLTGLPPEPAEIDRFLADRKPGAYERLVDRLLASPRYGEHMAVHWVDAARYADTSGYQADWERFMWPWREWVIKAYNRNLSFDQFTIQQLAGDLLPNPDMETLVATAFNRNHRINDEGGVIAAEYAVEYVVDRVDTTSTVWMGLTMSCARCHDHKYDPLSQEDFYSMFAFFNNVPEKGKDGRKGYADPIIDYPNPAVARELDVLEAEQEALDRRYLADSPELAAARSAKITDWKEQAGLSTNATSWEVWSDTEASSTLGVVLKKLPDHSWLSTGPNPTRPVYTVQGKLPGKRITGLRLEVMSHPSMTRKRLARSSNGNLVISEFEVAVKLPGTDFFEQVELAGAEADYHQANYPAKNAIDGKADTGWAPQANEKPGNRTLVFTFPEAQANTPDTEWQVTLRHDLRFANHHTGRFRISASADPAPRLEAAPAGFPGHIIAALQAKVPNEKQRADLDTYFRERHPGLAELRKQREALGKKVEATRKRSAIKVMVMKEMDPPRETFVLKRGQYDLPDPARKVSPRVPAALGPMGAELPRNRLGFAQWLVDPAHPLTARVTVNRYWQMLFGRGLVSTAEDFGAQGALPSHPELLDWLASEFVRSGWDIKGMLKLLVTSQTYRQSSKVTPALLEQDPENILLARGPRFRLSAYQLRDQALDLGGLLVNRIGGPSVKPYQPAGLWAEVSFQSKKRSTDFYVQDSGEKLYRRSLYTFWKRSVAPPQMATFDAAGREACSVSLVRTSTPLQALTLMNDVTYVEAARGLATRMLSEGKASPLDFAMKLASVEPTPKLRAILEAGLKDYRARFADDPEAAKAFVSNGESALPEGVDVIELAAFTAVASVVLNLDQVVTKE